MQLVDRWQECGKGFQPGEKVQVGSGTETKAWFYRLWELANSEVSPVTRMINWSWQLEASSGPWGTQGCVEGILVSPSGAGLQQAVQGKVDQMMGFFLQTAKQLLALWGYCLCQGDHLLLNQGQHLWGGRGRRRAGQPWAPQPHPSSDLALTPN